MVKKINFRYRGPLESEKCSRIQQEISEAINEVIEEAKKLLETTDQISADIISKVKRRTSNDATS